MGLLQLASGQGDGILANLGHNNRSQWISNKFEVFFQPGGQFVSYHRVCPGVLQQCLRRADSLARNISNRDHANGGGKVHEDKPDYAQAFMSFLKLLIMRSHQVLGQQIEELREIKLL